MSNLTQETEFDAFSAYQNVADYKLAKVQQEEEKFISAIEPHWLDKVKQQSRLGSKNINLSKECSQVFKKSLFTRAKNRYHFNFAVRPFTAKELLVVYLPLLISIILAFIQPVPSIKYLGFLIPFYFAIQLRLKKYCYRLNPTIENLFSQIEAKGFNTFLFAHRSEFDNKYSHYYFECPIKNGIVYSPINLHCPRVKTLEVYIEW